MRLGAYVMFMFCLSLIFYLLGYRSIAMVALYDSQAEVSSGSGSIDIPLFLAKIVQAALIPQNFISALGIGVVAVLAVSLITGFAAMYIIPAAFAIAFLNYVVYPFSFIMDPGMPDIVKYPLVVFFNLLTILAFLSFIRGGNV